jgi:hypothetical protein
MNAAALIALLGPLARRYFGEPNQRLSRPRAHELRFGTNTNTLSG